jgi:sugar lactone lactonase YvrE
MGLEIGTARLRVRALVGAALIAASMPLFSGSASATPGTITTVAGSASSCGSGGDGGPATSAYLCLPSDVGFDSNGNYYIADRANYRVRKVSVTGNISTVAGTGTAGDSGDGGPATSAQLSDPQGVAVDSAGNLYIAEATNRVRRVSPTGIISTVAGTGTAGYSGDGGLATSAQVNDPEDVAVDSGGNLYIADYSNNRVRKVSPTGTISTFAGGGCCGTGGGGPATNATVYGPSGLAIDAGNNIYFTELVSNRVRRVDATGTISTVAGNGTAGYSGDGGPAASAELNAPDGVAIDPSGNLYISDRDNARIRRVIATGTISSVVGNGTAGYSGDGGPAIGAELNQPAGLAGDSSGNLYLADYANYRIRKVDQVGTPSGGSTFHSDACDAAGSNILTGFVDGAYVKLKTAPGGTNTTWVCLAAEAAGQHVGGKLALNVSVPGLSVAGVDLDAASVAACSTNANNVRVGSGTIAGQPWWIDVTPSPVGSTDSAWICVRLTNSVGARIRLAPGVSIGLPSFTPDPTTPHVPPYTENAWPAPGQPSAACQAGGGTRLVNVTVGSTPVAVYAWEQSLTTAHLCYREGAAGGLGGQLTVNAVPSITGISTTNSTGPCPFPVFTSNNPSFGLFISNPGATLPVSACVSVGSTALGVTINTPSVGPIVSLQQDTA